MPPARPIDDLVFLVVDDLETMRHITVNQLRLLGAGKILAAHNGLEGLKLLHQHKIDMVLADLHMPLMDGLELLKAIRADAKLRKLPVIMITSSAERDRVDEVIAVAPRADTGRRQGRLATPAVSAGLPGQPHHHRGPGTHSGSVRAAPEPGGTGLHHPWAGPLCAATEAARPSRHRGRAGGVARRQRARAGCDPPGAAGNRGCRGAHRGPAPAGPAHAQPAAQPAVASWPAGALRPAAGNRQAAGRCGAHHPPRHQVPPVRRGGAVAGPATGPRPHPPPTGHVACHRAGQPARNEPHQPLVRTVQDRDRPLCARLQTGAHRRPAAPHCRDRPRELRGQTTHRGRAGR
ncbi:MAG: response regulator [Burkholderiales bacterium]|nr:response regulator [Burkholderiales bacterium]